MSATHPGEYLADELRARNLTQAALAESMGRPAQAICEIIRGRKRITAQTACELADVLGTSAEMWMSLQGTYDLAMYRESRR